MAPRARAPAVVVVAIKVADVAMPTMAAVLCRDRLRGCYQKRSDCQTTGSDYFHTNTFESFVKTGLRVCKKPINAPICSLADGIRHLY